MTLSLNNRDNAGSVIKSHWIITIIGWALTILLALLINWNTLNPTLIIVICSLIILLFAVSFGMAIKPVKHWLQGVADQKAVRRKRREIIAEICDVLKAAEIFLHDDKTHSLHRYISILHGLYIDNEVKRLLFRNLLERMSILYGWQITLLRKSGFTLTDDKYYFREIQDFTQFHRDLANIVREVNNTALPESPSGRISADDERIMKEKYNNHMNRADQILANAGKIDSGIAYGGFYRF